MAVVLRNMSVFNKTIRSTFNIYSSRRMVSAIATPSETVDIALSPKIETLVQQISNLTLLEVSELNSALKKTLNLPDISPAAFAAGPATASTAAQEEDVVPMAKASYTVKLVKYDESKKVALIKEIKSLLEDMNLVQAKKFIESAPVVVKADINKEEADKLKEALSKHGAEVSVN